jgi:hypothetical protein
MIDDKTIDRIYGEPGTLLSPEVARLLWRPAEERPFDADQIGIVAKLLKSLERKPPAGATVLVVGDAADIPLVTAALDGLRVIAGPAAQSAGAFAALVDSAADARAAAAANPGVIPIGSDIACIDAGACALAVQTRPKTAVFVARKANIGFDAAFRSVVIER